MSDLSPEEYQKEYDAAMEKLDAAETGSTVTTTAEDVPDKPEVEVKEPVKEETKPEEVQVDPLAEMREELEKAKKALKDTQAWGTKNAQRLADIERERLLRERETNKPEILESNPDLAEAIRYVTNDPTPQIQAQNHHQQWLSIIETAHPGIFQVPDGDELVEAIGARAKELGNDWNDPLVAIREISAQKLAHAERQLTKKFEAESKNRAQKAAMSVPSPGGSVTRVAPDKDGDEVNRIQKMSDEDFEKERRRVLGHK